MIASSSSSLNRIALMLIENLVLQKNYSYKTLFYKNNIPFISICSVSFSKKEPLLFHGLNLGYSTRKQGKMRENRTHNAHGSQVSKKSFNYSYLECAVTLCCELLKKPKGCPSLATIASQLVEIKGNKLNARKNLGYSLPRSLSNGMVFTTFSINRGCSAVYRLAVISTEV